MELDQMDFTLESIRLKNILSFKDATLDNLKQLGIIIGKNNSGKSNLFKLLKGCFDQKIPPDFFYTESNPQDSFIEFKIKVSETVLSTFFGYLKNLLIGDESCINNWKLRTANTISLENLFKYLYIKCGFIKHNQYYSSVINFIGFKIAYFEFNLIDPQTQKLREMEWKVAYSSNKELHSRYISSVNEYNANFFLRGDKLDKIISDSHPTLKITQSVLRDFIKNIRYIDDFRNFESSTEPRVFNQIESNGRNTPNILFGYVNNESEKLELLNQLLKRFYPDISHLKGQILSNLSPQTYKPYIIETYLNSKREFDYIGRGLHQLVVILIHLIELPQNGILCIEEPELYIHPQLQKQLLSVFKEFLPGHQLLISTHSSYFMNLSDDTMSIHQVEKVNGESRVHNIDSTNLAGLYSDLGIQPSDYLMNNGLILVEGPTDVGFLRNLLKDFLIDDVIEVLPFKGKHNLHFWADHQLISTLMQKNFKFLIILDGDEGNQKVVDSIQDPELKKKILLLPVREVENFFIESDVLFTYIKSEFPEKAQNLQKDQIMDILERSISNELIRESIVKAFIEKQPIWFSIVQRNKLLERSNNTDFLLDFEKLCKEWFDIENLDMGSYENQYKEIEQHYNKFTFAEKMKKLPGKEIRKRFNELTQAELRISIDNNKLVEYGKNNEVLMNFKSTIIQYFVEQNSHQ